jgi:hypothetical protein
MPPDALPMWTIYDHPLDFPDVFVARRVEVTGDGPIPGEEIYTGDSLDEVRAQLPPGLVCFTRHPHDDPVIVETWF